MRNHTKAALILLWYWLQYCIVLPFGGWSNRSLRVIKCVPLYWRHRTKLRKLTSIVRHANVSRHNGDKLRASLKFLGVLWGSRSLKETRNLAVSLLYSCSSDHGSFSCLVDNLCTPGWSFSCCLYGYSMDVIYRWNNFSRKSLL